MTKIETDKIRRQYDERTGKWYFSVVDVIALTTSSTNPSNYWKVLKNRLKKSSSELVTKCNQLKMKARDGKYYLTDTADMETLTEIIKLIPGARVNDLESCLAPFITLPPNPTNLPKGKVISPPSGEPEGVKPSPKASPKESPWGTDAELLVDAYDDGENIFIKAFVAGVSLSDLNIEVSPRKIIIEGKRIPPLLMEEGLRGGNLPPRPSGTPPQKGGEDYFTQELQWLSFSRTLELPSPVQTEKVETWEERGHLTIRLEKI